MPLISISIKTQKMTPEQVVQANLDAYNTNDIEGFMQCFAPQVTMYSFETGEQTAQGLEAVRAIYEPYFKASPKLHSTILQRTVFVNTIIDHESITGRYGSDEILELVLIYEVHDHKIDKITVLRKTK